MHCMHCSPTAYPILHYYPPLLFSGCSSQESSLSKVQKKECILFTFRFFFFPFPCRSRTGISSRPPVNRLRSGRRRRKGGRKEVEFQRSGNINIVRTATAASFVPVDPKSM